MINIERLQRMEDYVMERDVVSMDELSQLFKISMNTLRVDVGKLVRKGVVTKVYGGVKANPRSRIPTLAARLKKNVDIKKALAMRAAEYIQENDVIYMDAGSTVMYILDYVNPKLEFTVITNSLLIVNKASATQNTSLFILPGKYQHTTGAFLSADIGSFIEKYNIKTAFMSATGISEEGNLTVSSQQEYEVKRKVVQCSRNTVLLSDSQKIGKPTLMTFASLHDIGTLITDSNAPEPFITLCHEKDVDVITVQPEEKE